MGRISSNRKTADVLRKTIRDLESDPTIDTNDVSFVNLKCSLLQRILQLENDKAHAEAVIHLIESGAKDQPQNHAKKEDDSAIA